MLPGKYRARLKADIIRWNLARSRTAADLRAQLIEEYAPDIAKLGARIGRDLSAWTRRERFSR